MSKGPKRYENIMQGGGRYIQAGMNRREAELSSDREARELLEDSFRKLARQTIRAGSTEAFNEDSLIILSPVETRWNLNILAEGPPENRFQIKTMEVPDVRGKSPDNWQPDRPR